MAGQAHMNKPCRNPNINEKTIFQQFFHHSYSPLSTPKTSRKSLNPLHFLRKCNKFSSQVSTYQTTVRTTFCPYSSQISSSFPKWHKINSTRNCPFNIIPRQPSSKTTPSSHVSFTLEYKRRYSNALLNFLINLS